MGLFSQNENSVGVSPDEQHGPVVRFFVSYGTHFLSLCCTNIFFLITNIVSMLLAFVLILAFLPYFNSVFLPENFAQFVESIGLVAGEVNDTGADAASQLYYIICLFMVMGIIGILFICNGPIQTGLSYIYRNYARGKGTMFWADFKQSTKENWKKSLVAMIISCVVTAVLLFNIAFYANLTSFKYHITIATIWVVILILWAALQQIIYPLIASVDLPLRMLYKNALLMLLMKIFPAIAMVLLQILLLFIVPFFLFMTSTYFGYAIAILYYFVFAFSFSHYLGTFFSWELIDRYIAIDEDPEEDNTESDEAELSIDTDEESDDFEQDDENHSSDVSTITESNPNQE
ncbi:MAG TPA: DUF624 domain-containing protein [Bacillota bacterium]|nr:DUF624 domain-containing protein [Bacillota bacterium]